MHSECIACVTTMKVFVGKSSSESLMTLDDMSLHKWMCNGDYRKEKTATTFEDDAVSANTGGSAAETAGKETTATISESESVEGNTSGSAAETAGKETTATISEGESVAGNTSISVEETPEKETLLKIHEATAAKAGASDKVAKNSDIDQMQTQQSSEENC